MEILKVAVVGVGHLGQHHARVFTELDKTELVCVIDADERRAKEIGERLQVPYYTSIDDMPEEVQAVSIAAPTTYHFDLAKNLLSRKKHLLVEKPITTTLDEAREMVAYAKEQGCRLQVGHIERFNPAMMGIRKYISQPRYIESNRISPYSFRSFDVSVIHDMMIHDIDIVLELAQSEVVEVEALGVDVISGSEDMANVRLKFKNGCIADLTASRLSMKSVREIRLFQNSSYISMDYMTKKARILELSPDFTPDKVREVDPTQDRDTLLATLFTQFIQMEELELEGGEPLKYELGAFAAAILEDKPVEVPGEDGVRAMEIIEDIYKSIEENQWRAGD